MKEKRRPCDISTARGIKKSMLGTYKDKHMKIKETSMARGTSSAKKSIRTTQKKQKTWKNC